MHEPGGGPPGLGAPRRLDGASEPSPLVSRPKGPYLPRLRYDGTYHHRRRTASAHPTATFQDTGLDVLPYPGRAAILIRRR